MQAYETITYTDYTESTKKHKGEVIIQAHTLTMTVIIGLVLIWAIVRQVLSRRVNRFPFIFLPIVVDAIRAGAIGFLLKDAEASEIIEGVRAASRGEAFFRTEHAGLAMTTAIKSVSTDMAENPNSAPQSSDEVGLQDYVESMTERELDVLQEMAYGRRNSEIARNLHISEGTVKTHIHHILDKLGVENRTQAVILALRRGMVD